MTLDISPKYANCFIVWSGSRDICLRKINVFQAGACVNQTIGSRALMCLSKHSPDAVVAQLLHLRAFVCLLLFFSASSSHRLKRAIQVSNQVTAPLIVHPCNRIVEQIVDVPMPQNSGTLIGSHRKQIAHSLQPNREFWA